MLLAMRVRGQESVGAGRLLAWTLGVALALSAFAVGHAHGLHGVDAAPAKAKAQRVLRTSVKAASSHTGLPAPVLVAVATTAPTLRSPLELAGMSGAHALLRPADAPRRLRNGRAPPKG